MATLVSIIFIWMYINSLEATWHTYNNHDYYFSDDIDVKWGEAQIDCVSKGGYLVTINDRAEFDFLISPQTYSDTKAHWIGLYKTGEQWKWIEDDTTATYLEWDDDSPIEHETRIYVTIKYTKKLWRNVFMNELRRYICEIGCSCQNGGLCITGGCDCTGTRYTGDNCELDINECATNNHVCQHNTCVNTPGGYECDCAGKFTGGNCEHDVNECEENTHLCINGECMNSVGGYACNCDAGYTGTYCDDDINECDDNSHDCQHGSCLNHDGGYECLCYDGYSGVHCENDINECDNNIHGCVNGTCSNTGGSYDCSCFVGYIGELCDHDIDECAGNDSCNYHGNCTNTIGSFDCLCDQDYRGNRCEEYHDPGKNEAKDENPNGPTEEEDNLDTEWRIFTISAVLAGVSFILFMALLIEDRVYHYKANARCGKREQNAESSFEFNVACNDQHGAAIAVENVELKLN